MLGRVVVLRDPCRRASRRQGTRTSVPTQAVAKEAKKSSQKPTELVKQQFLL